MFTPNRHWFYVKNTRDCNPVRSRLYILAQRKKRAGRQYHSSRWWGEASQEASELPQLSREERARLAQEAGKAYGIKLVIERISSEEEQGLEAVINAFLRTQGYFSRRHGIPVSYIEEFLKKKH